jgi:hypothetical protein
MSSPGYYQCLTKVVVFLIMYVSSVQLPFLSEISAEIMDEKPWIKAGQYRQSGVRRHHEVLSVRKRFQAGPHRQSEAGCLRCRAYLGDDIENLLAHPRKIPHRCLESWQEKEMLTHQLITERAKS